MKISVCMLVKNSEKTLRATLESVKDFEEVLLLDTGSTDRTKEIASEYGNVKIVERPFTAFGPLRNEAAGLALFPWILALDSDEILSPPLLDEIKALSLEAENAYSLPRHNFWKGKQIKGCGWHPERVLRLYHRDEARFSNASVHEALQAKKEVRLKGALLHTPYRTVADFLAKMEHYSTLFAQQNQGKKHSSLGRALFHGAFAFFRSYFLKRGIFDGGAGLIISLYNASTTFYKYLKLAEYNQR